MLKCPQCKGTLTPGKLVSSNAIQFEAEGVRVPFLALPTQTIQVKVRALMCQECGHIELRGDTEKLRSLLEKQPPQ